MEDIMGFGIVSFGAIVILCYLIGAVVKAYGHIDKWIPVICGVCGLAFGLLAFYLKVPEFPAADPITACAVGVCSGLSATGINQIGKQLTKK